jgi:tetratricopeptide (TPR) repeat protein
MMPAPGTDTEDSLELTPDEVKRQIESLEDSSVDNLLAGSGELALEQSQQLPAVEPSAEDSLSLSYGDIPLDETGSTLPSMRAAQRSVQDYFDGTHSMSMSMEEVHEGGQSDRDVDEPAGRIPAQDSNSQDERADTADGFHQGSTTARRRAQAVIDARAASSSRTGQNAALVLIVLLIIAGTGGGAYLFKDQIMAMVDEKPSLVAQGQPQAPPLAVASNDTGSGKPGTLKGPTSKPLAADERDALLRAAEKVRNEERVRDEAQAKVEAQAKALADAAAGEQAELEAQAQAKAAAEAEALAAAQAEALAKSMQPLMPVKLEEALVNTPAAPSAFKISRSRGPGRVHKQLVSAFDAFQRGDDGKAMKGYLAVLKRRPRNRDALLGVAAISLRAGATEQAAAYYLEVLRRNPRDPAAQAGLIALQQGIDPISGESRVKELLARNPEDPNLHFALGNLYAEQGRWPEAQQSYFSAYRLDSASPDYAYNLAVSLDQLAQRKPALEYYLRADELANEVPATFDRQAARQRAAELVGS